MDFNELRGGIKISGMSFGCSRLGKALYEDNTKNGLEILKLAADLGINYFDTATNYTYGDSEKLLGKFYKSTDRKLVISTKGGTKLSDKGQIAAYLKPLFKYIRPFINKNSQKMKSNKTFNFSADFLEKKVDLSIKRMGIKTIDIYKLHNPDEGVLKGKEIPLFFENLKKMEKVTLTGLSLRYLSDIKKCNYLDAVDILQFPMNYLEFNNEDLDLLSSLKEKKIGLIGRTPFGRGVLTPSDKINTGGKRGKRIDSVIGRKKELIQKFNINEILLAIWFLKDMDFLDSILFSSFNPVHLRENIEYYESSVPDSFCWKDVVNL